MQENDSRIQFERERKNSFMHMEINKGMYGLPQDEMLVNKHLKKHLVKFGYCEFSKPSETPGNNGDVQEQPLQKPYCHSRGYSNMI